VVTLFILFYVQDKVQQSFFRFTAQKMKFKLQDTNDKQLELFKINAKDREYPCLTAGRSFGNENLLSTDLWSGAVFKQKLNYIRDNPVHPH
jgi:hypothetical protein